MPHSMTAFTQFHSPCDFGTIIWDIQSVNHRHLDIHCHLPQDCMHLEGPLHNLTSKHISRGKLHAKLHIRFNDQAKQQELNKPLIKQLLDFEQSLAQDYLVSKSLDSNHLLQYPGVIIHNDSKQKSLDKVLLKSFEEALDQLNKMRIKEGTQLRKCLTRHIQHILKLNKEAKKQMPVLLKKQQQHLEHQVRHLCDHVDPQRLHQELVHLAQKSDIEEELDRIHSHALQVEEILREDPLIMGRKLDFLAQELNREANTIGSKAIANSISHISIELKVSIEQLREQVQNIQ